MWGRGPIGSNGACSTPCRFSVTPSTTQKQIGPFWCCFSSGWVCVRSWTQWLSPTNSPVRLGISPVATTPTGFTSQRLEALFPWAGALGFAVCLTPQSFLLVYLKQMWGYCSQPCYESSPRCCPSPPLLLVWVFLLYLLGCQTSRQFNFLSVLVVFCF